MNRLDEARKILGELGFDQERCNARSAHVLLALLRIDSVTPWKLADNPMMGTRAIMDWIRDEFGVDYKPNTRETIRRQTLHQFVEAGLVEENQDKPDRPINSPKWNYRITDAALTIIRRYGERDWEVTRDVYLLERPGLLELHARRRELGMIPVELPDGVIVRLSQGGQNHLIRSVVHEFCSRFTPGGEVLYIGDADDKWVHFDARTFSRLGVSIDEHGKMPDLVVFMRERGWLFLVEACSSHGPVDEKRYRELTGLFGMACAGLVYVSCFPSRAVMRRYLAEIAWESEVWCSDNPDHMIHFDGSRFLGPYA